MELKPAYDVEDTSSTQRTRHEPWPLGEIDPKKSKFPCCLVWTPLPVVSWLAPFIGHVGICREDGAVLDFSGSNFVNVDDFAFGAVARYVLLDREQCCFPPNLAGHTCKHRYKHAEYGTGITWDDALHSSVRHFGHKSYNLFTCNCHSFAATCLNRLCYGGTMGWNMVNVAVLVPLIYSPSYDISFPSIEKLHPFDTSKWGRICRFLVVDGVLDNKSIVEPQEATEDDLLVVAAAIHQNCCSFSFETAAFNRFLAVVDMEVHSDSYLNSLKSSSTISIIMEVPPLALSPNDLLQQKVLHPFRKQVGGSVLAAKLAKERGWAINVGGGFHHCSGDKGGGFCFYADISLCIQYAFVQLHISRVMIIDLDAHQGNGHEKDFSDDKRVYILDMYNPKIYPFDYEARRYISQKVEVPSGTATDEYLAKLDEALKVAGCMFDPELVVYNAGTDILEGDPLGRNDLAFAMLHPSERLSCYTTIAKANISPDGIARRDEKVFRFARETNAPLVMLTSGGYLKSSARVIADSIENLSKKGLIDMVGSSGKVLTAA
ncbi:hypothetical protein Vadar_001471 [Vaccinium darrowii]|uniref:Uncharacterized protein n=1 Tax=Vaccinium darrowii TaxID=229202 RepID=A0ACB7WX86_9ERIC|nr:hypothetical protein Vadar_001471 [Vaccinium darrowii]